MNKFVILTLAVLGFTGTVLAQDLTDRTIVYSDLKVKCSAVDKSLSVYLNAKGNINRSQSNAVTLAVYTSKHTDWYVANKKIGFSRNLYNNWRSYIFDNKDPYNFEYKVQFEKMAYFENGKETKATLTRIHKHTDINIDQTFELNCKTKVTTTKVGLKPITSWRFNKLSEDHKAYVLTQITDAYTGRDFEPELTPAEEDLYSYFSQTGKADVIYSLDDIKKLKNISDKQKSFLTKLKIKEEKNNQSCIDDFMDRNDYDLDEDELAEILDNWSICSFDLSVARDVKDIVLGFVVNRFNDNGVDDSDGHDGSATTYDGKGKELSSTEWYP